MTIQTEPLVSIGPRETTHSDGCWSNGPRHYLCAYDRIKQLEDEVRMLQQQNVELDCKLAGSSEVDLKRSPDRSELVRLTDDQIARVWFDARIPGLNETDARRLIRAAERAYMETPS